MRLQILLGKAYLVSLLAISPTLLWAGDCDQAKKSKVFYFDPAASAYQLSGGSGTESNLQYVCESTERQSSRLGLEMPKVCQGMLDTRGPDLHGSMAANGMVDPRRCLMTASVSNFKKSLKDALSLEKRGNSWHLYSSSEIKKFMGDLWKACAVSKTLYERSLCLEESAHSIFDKFAAAREEFLKKDLSSFSSAEACKILKSKGLQAESISFLSAVAQNQHRPENLPAKDYPAFLECRPHDFPKMLGTCETEGGAKTLEAPGCLVQALKSLAEDHKSCNVLTRAGKSCTFSEPLGELRQRALELSVLSRACQAGLNFKSLFDPAVASRMDGETQRRCLTSEVMALREIQDPYAWLEKEGKSSRGFDDSEMKKAGVEKCEPEQPATGKNVASAAQRMMRIVQAADDVSPDEKKKPKSEPVKKNSSEKNEAGNTDELVQLGLPPDLSVDSKALSAEKEKLRFSEIDTKLEALESADVTEAEANAQNAEEAAKELAELSSRLSIASPEASPAPRLASESKKEAAETTNTTLFDPNAPLRPYGEMIAAGKDALKSYKENKQYDIDLSRFLLEGDFHDSPEKSQTHHQQFAKQWKDSLDRYQSDVRSLPQGSDQVHKLTQGLIRDYLKNYTASQARLTGLMKGQGGNCEAETKMLASAMNALSSKLEPPWSLGVQFYDDHMQFVAYNESTHLVWNLLSGGVVTGVEAPIYHPLSLVKGYLDGHGEKTDVSDSDLLLLNVDPEFKGLKRPSKAQQTSTTSKYPKANVSSGMPVPPFAEISEPSKPDLNRPAPKAGGAPKPMYENGALKFDEDGARRKKRRKRDRIRGAGGGKDASASRDGFLSYSKFDYVKVITPSGKEAVDYVVSFDDKVLIKGEKHTQGKIAEKKDQGPALFPFHKFKVPDGGYTLETSVSLIMFRNSQDVDRFLDLADARSRKVFLDNLARQELAEASYTPEFETMLQLMKHPESVSGEPDQKLYDFVSAFVGIVNQKFAGDRRALASQSPKLAEFFEYSEKFSRKFVENPGDFIQFVERRFKNAPSSQWNALEKLSHLSRIAFKDGEIVNDPKFSKSWGAFISDPANISFEVPRGVNRKAGQKGERPQKEVLGQDARKDVPARKEQTERHEIGGSQAEEFIVSGVEQPKAGNAEKDIDQEAAVERRAQVGRQKVEAQKAVTGRDSLAPVRAQPGEKNGTIPSASISSKIKASPRSYLALLKRLACKGMADVEALKKYRQCPGVEIFNQWTPQFSQYLVKNIDPKYYGEFMRTVYWQLRTARKGDAGEYPDPFGEKIELHMAELLRKILKDYPRDGKADIALSGPKGRLSPYKNIGEYLDALDAVLPAEKK